MTGHLIYYSNIVSIWLLHPRILTLHYEYFPLTLQLCLWSVTVLLCLVYSSNTSFLIIHRLMGYWKSDKSDQSLHYSKYNSLSYIQLFGDLVFLQPHKIGCSHSPLVHVTSPKLTQMSHSQMLMKYLMNPKPKIYEYLQSEYT